MRQHTLNGTESIVPHVNIALCTYNGARHLEAQLASLEAQTHQEWDLWVSDDGSTDATRDILRAWAEKWQGRHALRLLDGPRKGASVNFMALLCHENFPENDFVALSDQDDVWLEGKLERALARIGQEAAQKPVLYGAQSRHVDQDLRSVGRSHGAGHVPSFGNALSQNIVSGHSAVLNPAALGVVRRAGIPASVAYHDWWLYQLISGVGGAVIIDDAEVLLYRQHGANAMGAHQGLQARAKRLRQLFDGTYGDWLADNIAALQAVAPMLNAQNRAILDSIAHQPRRPGLARLRALQRAGVRRQAKAERWLFNLAALLGRL